MLELSVYNKFNLLVCKAAEWEDIQEEDDFFKIIFVLSGEGRFEYKGDQFSYEKDSFFLIGPGERYSFNPPSEAQVLIITLNLLEAGQVRRKPTNISPYYELLKHVENVFNAPGFRQGGVISHHGDRSFAAMLTAHIASEMLRRSVNYKDIVKSSVFLLMHVLNRNVKDQVYQELDDKFPVCEDILEYVHKHIDDSAQLKPEVIATRFFISVDCLADRFLTYTGYSLKQYILNYKTDLFKSRTLGMDVMEYRKAKPKSPAPIGARRAVLQSFSVFE